ncbi:MAG: CDP-alcohol phosphatidyltransferase family protein [Caldilinea sp.]|nr:CDP-alcohol phosphatidyltransferase family protein [Caldilineaceae bacterium]MCO5212390.1 CDP-alcohol phosphatidyltransferase family protein [Caldilinea sp.]HRW50460.1 CDP-alcohol phosphatidyltransferase family protein [Caldilinea sp.]
MRDAALRKQKDRLMAPLAGGWAAAIHPNHISVLALVVGLLAAWATWQQWYWAALVLWIGNRVLDGLDGVIARVHHKQSDFGGYLDLILDFVVYLAIPIAFVAAMPTTLNLWAAIALISSFVLNLLSWSTLSAILEKRHLVAGERLTAISMPPGLIEGAETIAFYTLFFLLPGYVGPLFMVMAALVVITAAQRVWWAWRHLEHGSQ